MDEGDVIVSTFFFALDLILFLLMVSGTVVLMQVGNQVGENTKAGMSDRDIMTAKVSDEEKGRFLFQERDAAGIRASESPTADVNDPATQYDGLLTGEEVINAILAMEYYRDPYSDPPQAARNGAWFDAASGEICPQVVVVKNGRETDVGAQPATYTRSSLSGGSRAVTMSAIRYAQEFDVGKLAEYVDTDAGWLYKRTYSVYDDGNGDPDQKALQSQIRYTRVAR